MEKALLISELIRTHARMGPGSSYICSGPCMETKARQCPSFLAIYHGIVLMDLLIGETVGSGSNEAQTWACWQGIKEG